MSKYNHDETDKWLIKEIVLELMERYDLSEKKADDAMRNYSNFFKLLHEMPDQVHHDSPDSWAQHIYKQANELGAFKSSERSDGLNYINILSDPFGLENVIEWDVNTKYKKSAPYIDRISDLITQKDKKSKTRIVTIPGTELPSSINVNEKIIRNVDSDEKNVKSYTLRSY